ncbi:hypothetical protein [Roseateles chitinivorans]|uniref:hypothetical protein n=1 Tax=Roseateles chitinivorans TaxID=2917965 RepID=UPI003D675ECF
MSWIKALIVAALVAAAGFGVAQLRAHWIGTGEARVQALWNKASAQAAARAASATLEQNRNDLARFRAAERNADEQERLEQSRGERLTAARAESDRLRNAIAERDAAARVPETGGSSAAAFAREAAAARELLGRCEARYLAVAAAAEELRDQVAGLQGDAAMCRGTATR